MNETKHDYQGCLVGNHYDRRCTGSYPSWSDFKKTHLGFCENGFDDRYHFVFRYDINRQKNNKYELELCVMLQRKGIYTHLYINNIEQEELDSEVKTWLQERHNYITNLWAEVSE